jgi:hypothetical protein
MGRIGNQWRYKGERTEPLREMLLAHVPGLIPVNKET